MDLPVPYIPSTTSRIIDWRREIHLDWPPGQLTSTQRGLEGRPQATEWIESRGRTSTRTPPKSVSWNSSPTLQDSPTENSRGPLCNSRGALRVEDTRALSSTSSVSQRLSNGANTTPLSLALHSTRPHILNEGASLSHLAQTLAQRYTHRLSQIPPNLHGHPHRGAVLSQLLLSPPVDMPGGHRNQTPRQRFRPSSRYLRGNTSSPRGFRSSARPRSREWRPETLARQPHIMDPVEPAIGEQTRSIRPQSFTAQPSREQQPYLHPSDPRWGQSRHQPNLHFHDRPTSYYGPQETLSQGPVPAQSHQIQQRDDLENFRGRPPGFPDPYGHYMTPNNNQPHRFEAQSLRGDTHISHRQSMAEHASRAVVETSEMVDQQQEQERMSTMITGIVASVVSNTTSEMETSEMETSEMETSGTETSGTETSGTKTSDAETVRPRAEKPLHFFEQLSPGTPQRVSKPKKRLRRPHRKRLAAAASGPQAEPYNTNRAGLSLAEELYEMHSFSAAQHHTWRSRHRK